jgi:proteic killer suppression protein
MEADFDDESLRRLESDLSYDGGFGREVVKAFRKRLQLIRSAPDERDFYALKSLHFEKLQGELEGHYSMRLNLQWRLILRLAKRDDDKKTAVIVSIADYH